MTTYEEEFKRLENTIHRLMKFALLGKSISLRGQNNFVKAGPNIIVGNHIGSFKDIAVLLSIVPRLIVFTANKQIFDKHEFNVLMRKHLKRHLKKIGLFLDLLIKPFMVPVINFITGNIAKIGTVPVELDTKKRMAIERCQDTVEQGRALILLQGRGRIVPEDKNPYVHTFRKGVAIISYNLYKEKKISVPITPLAMFGTHWPFPVPKRIRVNVGEPMFIKDFWAHSFDETVENFRLALEERVKGLLKELLYN